MGMFGFGKKNEKSSKVVRKPVDLHLALEMAKSLELDKIKGVTIAKEGEDLRRLCTEQSYMKDMEGERVIVYIDNLPHPLAFMPKDFCCYYQSMLWGKPLGDNETRVCPCYGGLGTYKVLTAKERGSHYNGIVFDNSKGDFELLETIESNLSVEDLNKIAQFLDYLKSLAQ